jgi:hypothetical protein
MANKYKYNIGDSIIYLGGLYKEYQNKSAVIIEKSYRKSFAYYVVKFEDGKTMELREGWIKVAEVEDEV